MTLDASFARRGGGGTWKGIVRSGLIWQQHVVNRKELPSGREESSGPSA